MELVNNRAALMDKMNNLINKIELQMLIDDVDKKDNLEVKKDKLKRVLNEKH